MARTVPAGESFEGVQATKSRRAALGRALQRDACGTGTGRSTTPSTSRTSPASMTCGRRWNASSAPSTRPWNCRTITARSRPAMKAPRGIPSQARTRRRCDRSSRGSHPIRHRGQSMEVTVGFAPFDGPMIESDSGGRFFRTAAPGTRNARLFAPRCRSRQAFPVQKRLGPRAARSSRHTEVLTSCSPLRELTAFNGR